MNTPLFGNNLELIQMQLIHVILLELADLEL